jgi:hypothetical protein
MKKIGSSFRRTPEKRISLSPSKRRAPRPAAVPRHTLVVEVQLQVRRPRPQHLALDVHPEDVHPVHARAQRLEVVVDLGDGLVERGREQALLVAERVGQVGAVDVGGPQREAAPKAPATSSPRTRSIAPPE